MSDSYGAPQASRPENERRRFPRYPWVIPAELKTSDQGVSQGSLLNMGRGGGMLETEAIFPRGDLLRLRIGGQEDFQPGWIVLVGRTIWSTPGRKRYNRYGVAFLRGQGDSYKRLQRFREVVHAKGVAGALGCLFVDIRPSMVETRTLSYINRDLAFSLNCIPIKLRGERLMVAMAEPGDPRALKKLQLFSRCRIVPVAATPSSIRNTLNQCWGEEYVPSGRDRSEAFSFGTHRQKRKPRILALASSTPNFSEKRLAVNLAAVLNRDERRAVVADLHLGRPVLSDDASAAAAENSEWMILTLPMDAATSALDWAIRADEALLVVSPSYWQKGCFYLEAAFDRFVQIQKHPVPSFREATGGRRTLEFSVVCAPISDLQEGFKIFSRIEKRVHQELDMREPEIDIRLHYMGGILGDDKIIQKAEETGVPMTIGKPHSPASECMAHIARSLLKPVRARDPRVHFSRSLVSRIFG